MISPKSSTRRLSSKGRRSDPSRQNKAAGTSSPRFSSSSFLIDQGGVERIIQEAAKGVYNRSEKWGVTRALRSAVQGLQSGNASPKKNSNGIRWSLDDDKPLSDNSSHLTDKIRALEQRNIALAKMLEKATEELWIQQKILDKEEVETNADALTLALAKIQFVQVYLENSNMPFPTQNLGQESTKGAEPTEAGDDPSSKIAVSSTTSPAHEPSLEQNSVGAKVISEPKANPQAQPKNGSLPPAQPATMTAPPESTVVPDQIGPSPFHRPRPSLVQSSFSWMLGEDQRRSSFVSSSPFPSEKRIARGKAGFLFGDDKIEGGKHSAPPKGKESQVEDDEESITLGTLKAGLGGD